MTTLHGLAALAASLIATAGPAAAQRINPQAEPDHGRIDLNGDFSPDPHVTQVDAGGTIAADSVKSGCEGYVSRDPDVRLDFSTRGRLPLIVSVGSLTDTTLLIRTPDGAYHCDDDGGERASNPAIAFRNPQSGRYTIWVGTYSSGAGSRAELHISEVRSQ